MIGYNLIHSKIIIAVPNVSTDRFHLPPYLRGNIFWNNVLVDDDIRKRMYRILQIK